MSIKGGYILQPRAIEESDISFSPPHVREIWSYLLRNANSSDVKYKGYNLKRGQLFRSYQDIRDALSWKIGYRTERYSESQTKGAMKFLRDTSRINTTKQLGGVLITICNYEYYQNPKNYETTNDKTDEPTNGDLGENQSPPDNNKNEKNERILLIKGEQKIISESLFKTLNSLLSDQIYLETICMNNSVRDIEDMKDYLKSFFVELENRGENYKDEADAKYHFASWLKKELKESESKSKPHGRRSDKVTPENINDIWK